MLSSSEASNLSITYKRASNVLKQAIILQSATLRSVTELARGDRNLRNYVSSLDKDITKSGKEMEKRLFSYYEHTAKAMNLKAVKPSLNSSERKARKITPKPTALVKGYMGTTIPSTDLISKETEKEFSAIGKKKIRELRRLIDGKRNALEITQTLDAQFESPTEAQDVLNYLELLKLSGLVSM